MKLSEAHRILENAISFGLPVNDDVKLEDASELVRDLHSKLGSVRDAIINLNSQLDDSLGSMVLSPMNEQFDPMVSSYVEAVCRRLEEQMAPVLERHVEGFRVPSSEDTHEWRLRPITQGQVYERLNYVLGLIGKLEEIARAREYIQDWVFEMRGPKKLP